MKLTNLAVTILGVCIFAGGVRADTFIVAPNGNAGTEAASNNGFPFNIGDFGTSAMRYQQVYGSSQFSALGGPGLITQILFRPDDQTGGAFSTTLPDIQINMSTTAATVDGLSTTFASNVGGNNTIVYARGSLSLSSAFTGPVGGPKDFDIVINLTTPFLYDPGAGNLLMEVFNFGGGFTTQFDAAVVTDGVSRLFSTNNSATATTGGTDTSGLVTEFRFGAPSAVPEPSTLLLLGTAAGLLLVVTRRRLAGRQ